MGFGEFVVGDLCAELVANRLKLVLALMYSVAVGWAQNTDKRKERLDRCVETH